MNVPEECRHGHHVQHEVVHEEPGGQYGTQRTENHGPHVVADDAHHEIIGDESFMQKGLVNNDGPEVDTTTKNSRSHRLKGDIDTGF